MSELGSGLIPSERTLDGSLGIEYLDRGEDFINGRIRVEDRVRQPYGIVHGGAMLSLAESLTSAATAYAVLPEGKIAMGQEINCSFMRPISDGHVNAAAKARRRGRSAWNWEVEISDDEGRLCALVRVTIAVREARGEVAKFAPESS